MSATKNHPIRIAIISDGRPGHYNQSRGLVRLLAKERPVTLHWCDAPIHHKWLRPMLQWCVNQRQWHLAHPLLQHLHKTSPTALIPDKTDLVIGTGGNTRFLLAWLSAKLGVKTIYIGSLRGLDPDLLGKVMTLTPTGSDNNIIMPFAPVDIDTQDLARQGLALTDELQSQTPLYTLIIGGSRPDCHFEDNDWKTLANAMQTIAERDGIRWLLTTSPRTGVDAEKLLRQAIAPRLLAKATWFATNPEKVMQPYLGAAQRVYVTEDSTTMVTEAIVSGKPVTTLSPRRCNFNPRHEQNMQRFAKCGGISRQTITKMSSAKHNEHRADITSAYQQILQSLLRYVEQSSTPVIQVHSPALAQHA